MLTREPLVLDENADAFGARLVDGVMHVIELLDELDVDGGRVLCLVGHRDPAPQGRDARADRHAESIEERGQVTTHHVHLLELPDQPVVRHPNWCTHRAP
ncbi:MAG: hypothetical protein ACXVPR_04095 [Actinomycetota bacterium]